MAAQAYISVRWKWKKSSTAVGKACKVCGDTVYLGGYRFWFQAGKGEWNPLGFWLCDACGNAIQEDSDA